MERRPQGCGTSTPAGRGLAVGVEIAARGGHAGGEASRMACATWVSWRRHRMDHTHNCTSILYLWRGNSEHLVKGNAGHMDGIHDQRKIKVATWTSQTHSSRLRKRLCASDSQDVGMGGSRRQTGAAALGSTAAGLPCRPPPRQPWVAALAGAAATWPADEGGSAGTAGSCGRCGSGCDRAPQPSPPAPFSVAAACTVGVEQAGPRVRGAPAAGTPCRPPCPATVGGAVPRRRPAVTPRGPAPVALRPPGTLRGTAKFTR